MLKIKFILLMIFITASVSGQVMSRKWYFDQQDAGSPPANPNILEDSSFVYGNWNAANAVWWTGTWSWSAGKYSYGGSGTATLITEPTYGTTWEIAVADGDDWEIGFEVANATSGLYLMMDLYEASFTNRQNALGSTFQYYLKANGVHWVDFTRTTKADKLVITASDASGGAGDLLWVIIREK